MLKRNGKPVAENAAEQNGAANTFEFRENDRINAQINGYIKENPKHWEVIKAMPRERLERHVVFQQLRFNARKEKLDNGLLRKIEANPELKQDFEKLLGACSGGPARPRASQHRENARHVPIAFATAELKNTVGV